MKRLSLFAVALALVAAGLLEVVHVAFDHDHQTDIHGGAVDRQ